VKPTSLVSPFGAWLSVFLCLALGAAGADVKRIRPPEGTLYRGNPFNQGESVPNAPSPDTVNNVEGVRGGTPAPGKDIVRVRASHVADVGRSDTPAVD
jgi:hypothetical protein